MLQGLTVDLVLIVSPLDQLIQINSLIKVVTYKLMMDVTCLEKNKWAYHATFYGRIDYYNFW